MIACKRLIGTSQTCTKVDEGDPKRSVESLGLVFGKICRKKKVQTG